MTELETRVRDTIRRHAGGLADDRPLRPMLPPVVRRRVRRRQGMTSTAVALVALLGVLSAIGVSRVVPHGDQTRPGTADDRGPQASWPEVVVGDPADGYVGPSDGRGAKHVLMSGTVDGLAFSFIGFAGRDSLPNWAPDDHAVPCLEVAGPANPNATPPSPGEHASSNDAASGGVGGFCAFLPRSLMPLAFPSQADVMMRAWAPDPAGWEQGRPIYTGFVSPRVASLSVHLHNGTSAGLRVLRWVNPWNAGAFILFPPADARGAIVAYDEDGRSLARAPLCPPEGDVSCDISPVRQLAPVPD